MKKLVTAALLGAAFALGACGDSYDEGENAEAYDGEAANTTTAPAGETPAPAPTGDGPEPEPTDAAPPEPAPAEPDDY